MAYFEVQLTQKLHRLFDVGPDTVIGRAPQCEIQLLSRAVSRRHARIEFDGTQAIVSDLGTKNGIKLNGQTIQGAAVVSEGDKVVVGDIVMIYRGADRSVASQDVIDLRNRPAGPEDARASMRPKATFVLRAETESLNQFQATVARARISALEFDDVAKFKLQVALREAIENARVHGCQGDRNRFVHVTFHEDEDEFLMSVSDEGGGFNIQSVLGNIQDVDALEAIRDREPEKGPLGLRIILDCVDRLQFAGRGSTAFMGKVKAAGQLLMISEEAEVELTGEEPTDPNPNSPFEPSDEGPPIQMGDLFG